MKVLSSLLSRLRHLHLKHIVFRGFCVIFFASLFLGSLCGRSIEKIHRTITEKSEKERILQKTVHMLELEMLNVVRDWGEYAFSSSSEHVKQLLDSDKRFIMALQAYDQEGVLSRELSSTQQFLLLGQHLHLGVLHLVSLQHRVDKALAEVEQANTHLRKLLREEKGFITTDVEHYSEKLKIVLNLEHFVESIFALVAHHLIREDQGFYEGIYDVERDYKSLIDARTQLISEFNQSAGGKLQQGFEALIRASYSLVQLKTEKMKLLLRLRSYSEKFSLFLKQNVAVQVDQRNIRLQEEIDNKIIHLAAIFFAFYVVMIILGGLFYLLVSHLIVKPVMSLTEKLQTISEHEQNVQLFSEEDKGCVEVKELIDTFSSMLQTINEKEVLLKKSIENMEEAFLLCQLELRNGEQLLGIVDANSAMTGLFSIRKQDVLGRNIEKIFPWFKDHGLADKAWKVFHFGQSAIAHKIPYVREERTVITEWTMYRVHNGVAFIIRDVTKQLSMEQELVHAKKLVAVGEMAAGVAHEIGNPLTAVNSVVQLLKKNEQDPLKKQDLTIVDQNIQRIRQSLQNLVEFSRVPKEDKEAFALAPVLDSVATLLRYHKKFQHIELEVETTLTDNLKIMADPQQIEQVFVNLAINAADAIEAKRQTLSEQTEYRGSVRIVAQRSGQMVRIKVEDNGCGMTHRELQRIFEPFYTTKKKNDGSGTGLGLTIVKNTVERFGGSIRVFSEKNKGTTMDITFPLTGNV